jgi:hypothetical protein
LKNFLLFEGSWERISSQLNPRGRFQPVLFHKDGSLSLHGKRVESVPIHAAWLNFDFGCDRLRLFVDILMRADELEFVQTAAAGLDSRLFKTLARKPIRLCNSDAQAPAIAEFVLASILNRYTASTVVLRDNAHTSGNLTPFVSWAAVIACWWVRATLGRASPSVWPVLGRR